MTPAHTQAYPFLPTEDKDGTPTVCHVCGRHATGIGAGSFKTEPRWLCQPCIVLIDRIRDNQRLDAYEMKALDGGVDAVGDYVAEIGKTDLGDYDELEQRMLVKAAWQGAVRRLHEMLSEGGAPF